MISYGVLLVATTAIFSSQALESGEKVHLEVYYESQCPDCYDFFVTQLRPTAKSLSEYVDVNLVPYGNAQTVRKGDEVTFICQHGESECLLNKIHACSLARVKGENLQRVLLASCLFDFYDTPLIAGKKCAPKFGLKWKDVSECAKGAEGTKLVDAYGNETSSLNPPHRYVPYTAVDKYTGDDDYQNRLTEELKTVLCETLAKMLGDVGLGGKMGERNDKAISAIPVVFMERLSILTTVTLFFAGTV